VGRHFGHEPRLEFVPWDEFVTRVDAEHAGTTLEHIGRAPLYSMEKARTVLGFVPKHAVTDTVLESIDAWVAANRHGRTHPLSHVRSSARGGSQDRLCASGGE
jgi:hypothetical protein